MRLRHFLLLLLVAGCGSGGGRLQAAPSHELEPARFLLDFGAEHTSTLAPPAGSIDELEEARRSGPRAERLAATRDLAVAYLLAAELEADERTQQRDRRLAARFARAARSGSRDDYLKAETEFIELWAAWRGGERTAARLVERFIDRNTQSGDLFLLAWIIKGEIAFERERYDDAAEAYRYLVGQLEHPLYAFALYRTAQCHEEAGRSDEARQALEEVRELGCREGPTEWSVVAALAANQLGTQVRDDPDGRRRPATCPEPAAAAD